MNELTAVYSQEPETQMQALKELYEKVFDTRWDQRIFQEKRVTFDRWLCQIMYNYDQPVAFKLGYFFDKDTFRSWQGGVIPEFQGQGIAKILIRDQERWVREQGGKIIQTRSFNRFKNMMILNLKMGYDITGSLEGEAGEPKIEFSKQL